MDADHRRATGLRYVDRVTRETREVRGRVVVLCAQALESARILLNSATRQQPNGLANSSGVLGHYLMDHLWVAGGARGEFPDLTEPVSVEPPAPAQRHLRDPVPQHRHRARSHTDFLRGYGFQGRGETSTSTGRPRASATRGSGPCASRSSASACPGFGECLPYFGQLRRDRQGDHGHLRHPGAEDPHGVGRERAAMIPDMAVSAAEMLDAAGAKNIQPYAVPDRVPGYGIHEVGVARMGARPEDVGAEPVPAGARRARTCS